VSRTVPGCSYKLATPRRKQRVDTNTICTDRYANARTKHVKSSRRNAEDRTNEETERQVETDKIRGHGGKFRSQSPVMRRQIYVGGRRGHHLIDSSTESAVRT
jgi:hypothetical protein